MTLNEISNAPGKVYMHIYIYLSFCLSLYLSVYLHSQVCKHDNSADSEKNVKLCKTNKQHVTIKNRGRSALVTAQETEIYNDGFLM